MSSMEITPSMMVSIAGDIKKKMEEWESNVTKIYQLHAELDAMWDGNANAEFNRMFEEDRQKFTRLSAMMDEYQSMILAAASNYTAGEEEAKTIVSRR